MDKEQKYGWCIMAFGFLLILAIAMTYNADYKIGTILSILDPLLILGVGIPCIILGSVMTNTAPDFIMKKYKKPHNH